MKFGVEVNVSKAILALDRVRPDIAKPALVRAMQRTMEQARTGMSREIRSEFAIAKRKVDERLRIVSPRVRDGQLELTAALESPSKRGRSMNVISFGARQVRRGVSIKIKRGGARKVIRSAFIANEGRTVFVREGKARKPIKAVQTIDVPQMFNAKRVNSKIVALINERFPAILERELRFYMTRAGLRRG